MTNNLQVTLGVHRLRSRIELEEENATIRALLASLASAVRDLIKSREGSAALLESYGRLASELREARKLTVADKVAEETREAAAYAQGLEKEIESLKLREARLVEALEAVTPDCRRSGECWCPHYLSMSDGHSKACLKAREAIAGKESK